jgi:predicted ATPase
MVTISLQHGTSRYSASAYGFWGVVLGTVFRRSDEGYRFARLACDLVEKHGFIAGKAKVYIATGTAAVWMRPIAAANRFLEKRLSRRD